MKNDELKELKIIIKIKKRRKQNKIITIKKFERKARNETHKKAKKNKIKNRTIIPVFRPTQNERDGARVRDHTK